MIRPECKTLFHVFENGLMPVPEAAQRILFFYADGPEKLASFSKKSVSLWQPHKPVANRLEQSGYQDLNTDYQDGAFDFALCLVPKQKLEAQCALALALRALKPGGSLIASAANDAGGKRLPDFFKALGLRPESVSKHKARAVWAVKDNQTEEDVVQRWIENGSEQFVVGGSYHSMPGLFSWNEKDRGSELLLDYIPDDLSGSGADFGCGYGLLSVETLRKNPDIQTLHCIDADSRALNCCRKNIESLGHAATVDMHWHDLRIPISSVPRLDWIIMNPPFHTGKKTEVALGQDFIQQAANHLKLKGTLYMVANNQLPYETDLKNLFSKVDLLFEGQGFKVIKAVR